MNYFNRSLLTLVRFPLFLIRPITTLLSGILVILTAGLFRTFQEGVTAICMLPLRILSYLYEKVGIIGKPLAILGLPFSILGDSLGTLLGHRDNETKAIEMCFFESYPYSYSFSMLLDGKMNYNELKIGPREVIRELIEDPDIEKHLPKRIRIQQMFNDYSLMK